MSVAAAARIMSPLAAGLLAVTVFAGCGGEREQLSRELADTLAAAGVAAEDVQVFPPHGMVPHWNVELRVAGGEAEGRATCGKVEELASWEGEGPYLVRVYLGSGSVVECGWSRSSPSPGPTP